MIFKATNLITQELDKANIRYTVKDDEDSSIVRISFSVDNGPVASVYFIPVILIDSIINISAQHENL